MKNSETKDFIAYEYLSINVSSEKEPLYIDCYENFGWLLINNMALIDKEDYYLNNANINNHKPVNIKFKRDRKIKNKTQLLSLQRKLESALKAIETLEKEPSTLGTMWGIVIGTIGTVFLSISVFSITASQPLYIPFIICGMIGLTGWILPYFVYRKIKNQKQNENVMLIDEQYNTIYDTCEQAKKLIR